MNRNTTRWLLKISASLAVFLCSFSALISTAAAAPLNQNSTCLTDTIKLDAGGSSSRDFFIDSGDYVIDVQKPPKVDVFAHYKSDDVAFINYKPISYIGQV